LEQRPHPEQGFRACLGIVRLAGLYGAERLEAAAERAIDVGARTYDSVKSILANNLDPEASRRRDKRLNARLRYAKLRVQAAIEDVDYRSPRGLDRALFQKLAEGEWIEARDNLALVGSDRRRKGLAGVGARPQGLSRQSLGALLPRAQAFRGPRPGARLGAPSAHSAAAPPRRSPHFGRLGIGAARRRRPSRSSRNPRGGYGRRSTVITSQLPVDRWHKIIVPLTPTPSWTASFITPIASK
jgi:hypothetical protein